MEQLIAEVSAALEQKDLTQDQLDSQRNDLRDVVPLKSLGAEQSLRLSTLPERVTKFVPPNPHA